MIEITNEMRVWLPPYADSLESKIRGYKLGGLVFLPMDQDMSQYGWEAIGTANIHAILDDPKELDVKRIKKLRESIVTVSSKASIDIKNLEEQICHLMEENHEKSQNNI